MSGRKEKRKTDQVSAASAAVPTSTVSISKKKDQAEPKKDQTEPKKEPRRLQKPEPGTQAFSQITTQMGTQSPQQQLFPTDYGHDTANLAKQRALKDLKNLPYTDYRMVQNPEELEKVAQQVGIGENNNKDQEADYGDEYQDMVARVGQKAREQEKKKPVDIKDLARRLAAVKLRDEK